MGQSTTPGQRAFTARTKHWSRQTVFASAGAREGKKTTRSKKSDNDSKIIRTAIQQSTLLGAMLTPQLQDMIDYMEEKSLKSGQDYDLSGGICIVLDGRIELKGYLSTKGCSSYTKGEVLGDVGLLHSRYALDGRVAVLTS